MTSRGPNGQGHASPEEREHLGSEVLGAFAELAGELELGRGDPESFFAANPALEPRLRELYRGWLRVDGLLRGLVGGVSLVRATLEELADDASEEQCRAAL